MAIDNIARAMAKKAITQEVPVIDDHSLLQNRNVPDQHSMDSITGLNEKFQTIQDELGNAFRLRGSVKNYSALDTINYKLNGDAYITLEDEMIDKVLHPSGTTYTWAGNWYHGKWVRLGATPDTEMLDYSNNVVENGVIKKYVDNKTSPIILDVQALGFNVEQIPQGGSTIDITDENRAIFNRLKNPNKVYLSVNGNIAELAIREFNGVYNTFTTLLHGSLFELTIVEEQYVTLKTEPYVANQHNFGYIKAQSSTSEDDDYLYVDNEGFGRVKKLPVDDTKISDATLLSSKGAVDHLACFKNISGQTLTFAPIADYPITLKADLLPTQEGSGTPSITNKRPIKGLDKLSVLVYNGINTKRYEQLFDEIIYGGTYVNNGILIINFASKTFNGSEHWVVKDTPNGRSPIFYLQDNTLGANTNVSIQKCSTHKCNPPSSPAWDFDGVWIAGNGVYVGGSLAGKYKDINEWKNELRANPMQILYELASPRQLSLKPLEILTMKGDNTITSNTKNIIVTTPILNCNGDYIILNSSTPSSVKQFRITIDDDKKLIIDEI